MHASISDLYCLSSLKFYKSPPISKNMEFIFGSEKRLIEFVSALDEKDRIAVIAHKDLDGMVSALIAERIIGKPQIIKFLDYKEIESSKEEIIKKKISKIIFLDLRLEEKLIRELEKDSDILAIDHHKTETDLNSKKTLFFLTESKYPASLASYDLFGRFQSFESDFLVAIAAISDHTFRENAGFISQIEEKYGLKKSGDILTSEIGGLTKTLSNCDIYFKDNPDKFYAILKGLKDISGIKKLERYSDIVEKEIKRIIEDFQKNSEAYSWGHYYDIKSGLRISSTIATMLSEKDRSKLYIFEYEPKPGLIKINARRQDGGLDCTKLLKEAVKGIPESMSGGHVPAAGADFPKRHLKEFKKNLLRILGD